MKKWREELFDQVYVAQHYEKNIFKFVNFFIDGFYEYVSKNLKFFRVKIEFLSIAIHNKKIQKIHIDSHKKWRGICFPYKNVFKKNENFELFVDYLFYLIDGIIIRAIIENKFIDNNQKENLKKIVLKNLKDLIK
ncbi:MAG TPA: hypothetical protein PLJ38_04590 [bacterium]|nr:hypothetical protein [bacterium]